MAIKITHDGDDDWCLEHCVFCRRPTHYWHEPKDVPVCQSCAGEHDEMEVPSKAEWLAECLRRDAGRWPWRAVE